MSADIATALKFVSDRVVQPNLNVPLPLTKRKIVDVRGMPDKDARERTLLRMSKQAGIFGALKGIAGNTLKYGLPGFTLGAGVVAAPDAVNPAQSPQPEQTAFQKFAPKEQ